MATMTFDNYLKTMKSGVVHSLLKIEMLRSDETVFSSFTTLPLSGNITTTATSGSIRRSCDIVLPNFDKSYIPDSNDINKPWINTKFMVFMGIINDATQETIFFPQGEFSLLNADPEVVSSYSNATVNLKADDKWSALNCAVGAIYQIPVGSSVTKIIRDILIICGDQKEPILEAFDDLTTATLRWGASDTYSTIIKQLSDLYSRESFYDSTGHFVLQTFKDTSILNTVWRFSTQDIQYQGASRIYKNSEVYNCVSCVGGTVDTKTYQAIARNDNADSDTRISFIGLKTYPISDDKIDSDEKCQARADAELAKRMRMQETISLTSSPLYHLDVNQNIAICDDSIGLHEDKYSIQEFQLDVCSKSAMTITAYKYNDTTEYEDLGLPV